MLGGRIRDIGPTLTLVMALGSEARLGVAPREEHQNVLIEADPFPLRALGELAVQRLRYAQSELTAVLLGVGGQWDVLPLFVGRLDPAASGILCQRGDFGQCFPLREAPRQIWEGGDVAGIRIG